jgi:hypothetical protein
MVPEGNDNEGKPRMGKWYAFLQFNEGGRLSLKGKTRQFTWVNSLFPV